MRSNRSLEKDDESSLNKLRGAIKRLSQDPYGREYIQFCQEYMVLTPLSSIENLIQ